MFAVRLLHVERWTEWRFLFVCTYLCVCVCVFVHSLRVWPSLGESAVFPLLLILKAFQASLPADGQPEGGGQGEHLSEERNSGGLPRFLSLFLLKEGEGALILKGLFYNPCLFLDA